MSLAIAELPTADGAALELIDTSAFPDWNAHPLFGEFSRRLYRNVARLASENMERTFAVMNADQAQLLAACTVGAAGVSMYNLPIVLAPRTDLSTKAMKQAVNTALDHLVALAGDAPTQRVLVRGQNTATNPTVIDDACIARLAAPGARIHAVADLDGGEAAIHRGLRKSFRSLVNWGRDNLNMEYANAEQPRREMLEAYKTFHARVAGGSAHGDGYWEVFWDEIVSGRGELSLGRLDGGNLVAGTFTTQAGSTAYYTSGVYDRDRFDKPLGHFPVFDAMTRAARRGVSVYDLGEIVPRSNAASAKDTQIGFFKKGFARRCELMITWSLDAS